MTEEWGHTVRVVMRQFLTAWEFWVPPIAAFIAIASLFWLFSHNQDLLRQQQIDQATIQQTKHLDVQVQGLMQEVKALKNEVGSARHELKEERAGRK